MSTIDQLRPIYAAASGRLDAQQPLARKAHQHAQERTVRYLDPATMPRRVGRLIRTPLTARMFDHEVVEELRAFRSVAELSDKAQLQLERVVGKPDFLPAWFLQRGAELRRTVAQVRAVSAAGRVMSGTGFLVGPGLLLTNAHVLDWSDVKGPGLDEIAPRSFAVFDYEDLHTGVPGETFTFALQPEHVLLSSPWDEFDYALVALAPLDARGRTRISDFGFNRLSSDLGKIAVGEPVFIIQHPHGQPKQVVLSDNRLIRRDDADPYLTYEADTDSGSSGAPVFNRQWEVVALHHAPQIARNAEGAILSKSGAPWTDAMDTDEIKFLELNEGIRISRIVHHLTRTLADPAARLSAAGRAALEAMLATSSGSSPPALVEPIPIAGQMPLRPFPRPD